MTSTSVQPTLDTEYISVERLIPNPDNVRSDLGDLSGLADSISRQGVLEPLIVYPVEGGWTLIAGHRRLAAGKLAGLTEFPCVIRQAVDKLTLLEMMLAENGHREGLDPIDEGLALVELRHANRYRTFAKLAEAVNHSIDWVQDRIVIVEKLPEKSWPAIRTREVSLKDAVVVARSKLDTKAKAKVLASPAADRSHEIEAQRRKAEKAARLKALRDEHGTVLDWPPRAGHEYPWGTVELGDQPGMLTIPVGLHTGCPGHVVVWQEWAKKVTAYCVEPHLHHLDPADYKDPEDQVAEDLQAVTSDMLPLTSIDGIGASWQIRDRHKGHCPHHRTLRLPWGGIEVCTDPTIHTNPRRKGYLPASELEQKGPGSSMPDTRPRWVMHNDAKALLLERVTEDLDDLQAPVRDAIAINWCPPADLSVSVVDGLVSWLESVAFNPSGYDPVPSTYEGPTPAALQFGLQACVDVGAPPPNLDEIRTRLDVITKGASDQGEEVSDE